MVLIRPLNYYDETLDFLSYLFAFVATDTQPLWTSETSHKNWPQ